MNVDIHIIKSNRGYIDACLESIKDEPVNIHFLKHVDNEHGKLRMKGFSMGNSPYVSLVDDDDIVIPGIFDRAIMIMEKGYSAYYSNHYVMNAEGNVYGKRFDKLAPPIGFSQANQMHHVVVYRREIIQPVLSYLNGVKLFDKLLLNLKSIYDGRVYGENKMGLYWRVHDEGIHKKENIKENPKEWHEIVSYYKHKIINRKTTGINYHDHIEFYSE